MPRRASRAAQGGGSIRKRADGTWEARYTVGRDPGTGRQVQKSVYGKTQAEVRKKLQAVAVEMENGTYVSPAKMNLKTWLDIWLAEFIGNVKENTAVTYTTQVRVHIIPALGAIKLTALTTPMIQAFYNKLLRGEGGTEPLSAKTIKNIHGVLHRALDQAVVNGDLKANPCNGVRLPRAERAPIFPLTEEQLEAFLEAARGNPYETLFYVDLFTGMRQSEIMGLTWDCVDFAKGTLLVDKQLIREKRKGGIFKFAPPKNDKVRVITPAPSVMALLKEHRRLQMEWRLKAGEVWDNPLNLVFTNEVGQHYSHNTLSDNFKAIAVRIGVPSARFHDMRHTYAVTSIQAGDDIKTIQENLGHHTAAFTLDVYGHVTERMKQDSAARMERFIQGMKKGKNL